MRTRTVRRAMAALMLALLPVLGAASCDQEPKKFPGAFPDSHTDVSAKQAFRDFHLDVPGSAKVVGYYATSSDDEYPMAAVLRMPCSAVPGFVSGNRFRKSSSADGAIAGVDVFAGLHGWSKEKDNADDRYLRSLGGTKYLGVIVHRTGTGCTVYLDA
jgi:hypothetical protein